MPAKPSSHPGKRAGTASETTKEFERLLKATPKAAHYLLRLFVTGTTPRSVSAIASIRALCEGCLAGQVDLEVVDIYQQPAEAHNEQIIAAPTLVREIPKPPRRMVGNLTDPQKVLVGLNLVPQDPPAPSPTKTKWISV